MLECTALAVAYGRHQALKGVDLRVAKGEIVVMLGANGAGKTTLLNALAGRVPMSPASQVRLDGQGITGAAPHQIVEAGLALVPEGRGVFGELSVRENLLLGAFARRARESQAAQLQRVLGLFPKLGERSAQQVRLMSGGEQQMVAIGRALMSSPTILMLDEPSLGLSPLLCTELFRTLKAVRETGVGILLVEQNARQSLAIADRAYLLENGHVVGEGPAAQMIRDPAVQAAYLGGAASATPASPPGSTAPGHRSPIALQNTQAALLPATVPQPGGPSVTSRSADSLIPTPIADLVQLATRVQAAQLEATRLPATTASLAGGSLAEALADIEAAAARARQRPQAESAALAPAPEPARPLPEIEVWRRPPIEIWRRGPDGRMRKLNGQQET